MRKMIQGCLELRDKYVYREEIAPWTKEPCAEPSTPKVRSDPFRFEPVEKTAVSFFFCFILFGKTMQAFSAEYFFSNNYQVFSVFNLFVLLCAA